MDFKIGDVVLINNPGSRYHCLIGKVVDYDEALGLYTVDTLICKIGVNGKYLLLNNKKQFKR